MTKHYVNGTIPFYMPPGDTGPYLTADPILGAGGWVPACLNHWQDNKTTFSHKVKWTALPDGLAIRHILDDSIPFECDILAQVRRGLLGFSYGPGVNSAAQNKINEWFDAWTVANAKLRHDEPFYKVRPIGRFISISHISYGDITEAACEHPPAWTVT